MPTKRCRLLPFHQLYQTGMHQCHPEATTYGHIFLLAEKTHADVAPQLGAIRLVSGRHPVLGQRDVVVSVTLKHVTNCYDGLGVCGVERQSTSKILKGFLELIKLRVVFNTINNFLNNKKCTHIYIYIPHS